MLESGEFFGIYPEGTRARDGRLHRGHTGPARLALRTGTPIVPVGIVGTREIQPPDAKLPRPFKRAEVRFGRPIDVSRYADRADDRLVLRQIIDEVMYEIRELTGQDYVDEYATKKAETFPSAETAHVVELDAAGATATRSGRRGAAPPVERRGPRAPASLDLVPGRARGLRYPRAPCPTRSRSGCPTVRRVRWPPAPPRRVWPRTSARGWPRRR